MSQTELAHLLRQNLAQVKEEIASQVILGGMDHDTYKFRCGVIAGISLSLEAISDTVRSLNDPESTYQ